MTKTGLLALVRSSSFGDGLPDLGTGRKPNGTLVQDPIQTLCYPASRLLSSPLGAPPKALVLAVQLTQPSPWLLQNFPR